MRMFDLMQKKNRGIALETSEIQFLLSGLLSGEIPDYQVSAFLMAVYFRGMEPQEQTQFTLAMAGSGDQLDLSSLPGITVDKHSTGGVGDKTTLVVAPLAAACGLTVAKMSGKGLGHTGGTIDKLESIPGFRTALSKEEFFSAVKSVGLAVAGQSGNLVPADKLLYALRDVTATVDSLPLIASSIMSKKLAAGANCIVLDVKVGSGAFLKTPREAAQLAASMVEIGEQAGRRCSALLTNMDQPLGYAIGNSLEVQEALAALQGNGPADLISLSKALAAELLVLAGKGQRGDCMRKVEQSLSSGRAYQKFCEMVATQGGVLDALECLPVSPCQKQVVAASTGWVSHMDTERIGMVSMLLGAGRQRKGDSVDAGAGLVLAKKTGDFVQAGEPLARLYCQDAVLIPEAESCFAEAVTISPSNNALREPVLLGRVERKGEIQWLDTHSAEFV